MTDLEKRILATQDTHRVGLVLDGERVVALATTKPETKKSERK